MNVNRKIDGNAPKQNLEDLIKQLLLRGFPGINYEDLATGTSSVGTT